jgi:DNA repair ATPase RecN
MEWSMFLERLELHDFRAYRDASVQVPPQGLVLVAGANNSGKSALLSALDVVAGSKQPEAIQHAAASEPARVLARFALSEEERALLLASVSDTTVRESDALTWLEWHFHSGRKQYGSARAPYRLARAPPHAARPDLRFGRTAVVQ